jgi:hypothetical protein
LHKGLDNIPPKFRLPGQSELRNLRSTDDDRKKSGIPGPRVETARKADGADFVELSHASDAQDLDDVKINTLSLASRGMLFS